MSELVALSFDSDASPRVQFGKSGAPGLAAPATRVYGWGIGWYPASEKAAQILKDPGSKFAGDVGSTLTDWDRFRSTLFLCHLRGHRRRRSQQDLQPFTRNYGGRQWIFAHDGDLERGWTGRLPLGEDPAFEPLGKTDSEHAFCWLLTRFHENKIRSISEADPDVLNGWLRELNGSGQLNLLVSDGDILAVYRDAQAGEGLWWTRIIPPHGTSNLQSDAIEIGFDAPEDPNRTVLVFASFPLSPDGWQLLEPTQLVLARRGSVVWDSENRGSAPSEPTSPAVITNRPAERLLEVVHETTYTYETPVERSAHRLLLAPMQDKLQRVESYELTIEPSGARIDYEDVFGNEAVSLEISNPYDKLKISSRSRVRVWEPEPIESRSRRETIPLVWMPWQRQMLSAYLLPMELPETQLEELSEFATSFVGRNDSELIGALLDLNETIFRDFSYVSGSTTNASTPFEVYQSRKGVCQDFANLMMCVARLLNVPARYRMGYIFTGADYENKIQSDASHAWVELYIPRVGWHGFDPTNGRQVGSDHVRIACGRNHRDASPTSGTIYRGGGTETLDVQVHVTEVS